MRDTSADKDGATTPASSGVEQNEKKMPTERGRIPVRRVPPKGGYLRRPPPNFGPLQNRTRPNLKLLPPPSQPLNRHHGIQNEQESSAELAATLSPSVTEESRPTEGTRPIGEENEDRDGTRISITNMSPEINQTLRGSGVPSSHRPTTKVGYFRRPQLYGGRFQNKTRTNPRLPQLPHRGPVRKPFPPKKLNGGSGITVGSQTNQLENRDSRPEIPENQSGRQDAPMPTQGVLIRLSGEEDTAGVSPSVHMDGHDATVRPQADKLEPGDGALVQTTKSREEETSTPDSNSDVQKERVNVGKHTGAPRRPTIIQTSSDSRHGAAVKLPKRQPPTRNMTAQHHTRIGHYMSGSQRREDKKTNNTAKRLLHSKTEQARSPDSKPETGSDVSASGVTREPLDHVRVTNQTSDGFTLKWDSPEGKYKNFVVTSKEKEGPKQKERKKDREEQEDSEKKEEAKHQPTKETESDIGRGEDENRVPESVFEQVPRIQSSPTAKPAAGSEKTSKNVLPGSARSFQFEDLLPQTEYTVTLLGKGPGLLSRLHKLVISTGTSHCDSRTTLITSAQCYNIVNVVKSSTENSLFSSRIAITLNKKLFTHTPYNL